MTGPLPPTRSPPPRARDRTALCLFFLGVLLYAATRLISIEDFPAYFFCDEAVHSVKFHELLATGGRGIERPNEFLPAYFINGGMFNLSLSVFVQGLASLLGGQSVATVRITSALASLSGAIALALLLRDVFHAREWWSIVAVLAVIPCWFLHSRTGFETVLMVSSYSWFLYFYLRYRTDAPNHLYFAMLAGAATFYAYAPGQGVMFITGLLLLLTDFRHHWAHRRVALFGALFALVLFVPYVRFRLQHPEMLSAHLSTLDSYWTHPIPLREKLLQFIQNYAAAFSPRFWFVAGADNAVRHAVPYHGHLPPYLAPFALAGLLLCFIRLRQPAHRVVLIATLASVFSSALVGPMVTRMLAFVVPFALCVCLGFDALLRSLQTASLHRFCRLLLLTVLGFLGIDMLRFSLLHSTSFTDDYGLYGLQLGTATLHRDTLPRYLKSDPEANLFITHTNANSPELFPPFFGWMNNDRVIFTSLKRIREGTDLPEPEDIVVLSPDEYSQIQDSPSIKTFAVREQILGPDRRPLYVIGHLRLREDFVFSLKNQPNKIPFPPWKRLAREDVAFSIESHGLKSGHIKSAFTETPAPVSSMPGVPIHIIINFDHTVVLSRIQIEAESEAPSKLNISYFGFDPDNTQFGASAPPGWSFCDFTLPEQTARQLRIDLVSEEPLDIITLKRVRMEIKALPANR